MTIKVKLSLAGNEKHFGKSDGEIVEIPFEEYIKGVVAAEISNAPVEACKAQAVAARTFAQYYMDLGEAIADTGNSGQAFIAARMADRARYPNAIKGADETAGEVLTFQGKPIGRDAHYSSANNGTTKTKSYKWPGSIDLPYLVAKEDPWTQAELNRRKSAKETIRYGHGVGLSQYGAMYAGKQGIGYREILSFYYPTTVLVNNYGKGEGKIRTLNDKEKAIATWAKAQVGSGYVWGSVGQTLTESKLAEFIAKHGAHIPVPLVRKWLGKKVFDCAGLVTAAFSNVLKLRVVSGASSQWKGSYWDIKGTIDMMPKDCVCMLYREKPTANPMQHTGIYCGDGIAVDARGSGSGVLLSKLESYPWTHWAIPKGLLSAADIAAVKGGVAIPTQNAEQETGGGNMPIITAKTNVNSLALRGAMNTTEEPIIRLASGSVVTVMEKVNSTWWKVQAGRDVGYMMQQYLTELGSAPINPGAKDDGDAGRDEVEDNPYAVHLLCKSQAEADAVLKLLKTAVVG